MKTCFWSAINQLKQTDPLTSAMAAHVVLLLLLFCTAERNGLLVEERDLQVISSKGQRVSSDPESVDKFFVSFRDLESPLQNAKDDVRTLPNAAFKLNDRKPNNFGFNDDIARQTDTLKYPAKSLTPKHSPELTLNHEKRDNLTNGEVEGVINAHSVVSSSEEEYAGRPQLHLETGVGDVPPERTRGRSKWVAESEGGLPRVEPRSRRRRSWLWNQFFVIEEYRGPEPVLIGRVSFFHNQSAREKPASNCTELCLCLISESTVGHFEHRKRVI